VTVQDNVRRRGIAIIGMGCCFPDANSIATYWDNICRGHVAIRQVPKERWNVDAYYSADHNAPDKTYSAIGGFLSAVAFDPKRFRIPPKTLESIDDLQKLALTAVADALEDAGLQAFAGQAGRAFDRDRCAVILGNAMGGEQEDLTSLRVWFPQAAQAMQASETWQAMSAQMRTTLLAEFEQHYKEKLPRVTEDSMPGELSNCITGRIANALDLRGPNFTTDAACAASMAALKSAVQGLQSGEFDLAIAGGADRSMDPPTYVKFSKIGALSGEMSAPFDARANGFVMGEGVGVLVLKRLEDAERDGDKIYAVIRSIGAASDGKGKGMTAPNPRGQQMAVERAYSEAGFGIETVGLFEAHGTSTNVGDATELRVLTDMLQKSGAPKREVPVGSVKSMIGHLKSAAGSASVIKIALALHNKMLPPSANFQSAPTDSPLHEGYLKVVTHTQPWKSDLIRRAGVSAFGFGGTNFHVVLEEHVGMATQQPVKIPTSVPEIKKIMPMHHLAAEITAIFADKTGYAVEDLNPSYNLESDLGIDTVKQAEILAVLRERYGLARDETFRLSDTPTLESIVAYVAKMIGTASTASESQPQAATEPRPSGSGTQTPRVLVFGALTAPEAIAQAQSKLAAVTSLDSALSDRHQATLATARVAYMAKDLSDAREKANDAGTKRAKMLAAQGIYIAEGEALAKTGKIAFLFPGQGSQYVGMLQDLAAEYPLIAETFAEANRVLEPIIHCKLTDMVWPKLASEDAREAAELVLRQTQYCQPAMLTADVALLRLFQAHGVRPDIVAGHSLGEYAACVAAGVMSFADALYAVSARGREMAGVEVPDCGKMAVVAADAVKVEAALAEITKAGGYVIAANKNCYTQTVIAGETLAVEKAIEAFKALGLESREIPVSHAFHCRIVAPAAKPLARVLSNLNIQAPVVPILSNVDAKPYPQTKAEIVTLLAEQLASPVQFIDQINRMYDEGARIFVEVGPRRAITGFVRNVLGTKNHRAIATNHHKHPANDGFLESLAALACDGVAIDFDGKTSSSPDSTGAPKKNIATVADEAIVVTGVAVALPQDQPIASLEADAFAPLLEGHNFIRSIDATSKQAILEKNIVRLKKTSGEFESLQDLSDVLQLSAKLGDIDLVEMYGIDPAFVDALDVTGRLAIAVGIDALRDAGLPLVRHYRTTSTGKKLPDRWGLPTEIGERTGVILASAFPAMERVIENVTEQVTHKCTAEGAPYTFNRKYLFRILPLGHAQLAQVIAAQGPNTQVNAACASGTQAIAIAQDWIRAGRCDRVLVVSADDATHPYNFPWIGAGFLAAGAATTESRVEKAAVPFGAERNGMILGSGASAFVIESKASAKQRGLEPIAEVCETSIVNSAFHGTRLDGEFIKKVLSRVICNVAEREGCNAQDLAKRAFFVSHETYTPARGGSSAAEVEAIRFTFGDSARELVIANTKGYTGHPMGATFEDVVAIKGLQRQQLPAVANLANVDPAFADLNFAKGGAIQADLAFRFAAGFGSQIAIVAYKRCAKTEARLSEPAVYEAWLKNVCGRTDLEIDRRTLRVAEGQGKHVWELGVVSLQIPTSGISVKAEAAQQAVQIDTTNVLTEITRLFAEQTGYDVTDLDPNHQLESDLGIDTVKQAEIFAVLRERYQMPKDESFKLAEVQTLQAIANYVTKSVGAKGTELAEVVIAPDAVVEAPVPALDRLALLKQVTELFAEQTGYDVSDLEPNHQLESDLGIDTVKQAEIFATLRERYQLAKDEAFKLADVQTLSAIVDYVIARMGSTPSPEPTPPAPKAPAPKAFSEFKVLRVGLMQAPERSAAVRAIQGRNILLAGAEGALKQALQREITARGAQIATEQTAQDLIYVLNNDVACIKDLFLLARTLGPGKNVLVVGLEGGAFGFKNATLQAAVLGGASGFTKALAKEWQTRCLTCDLSSLSDVSAAMDEWLSDGPLEIAFLQGQRLTVRRSDAIKDVQTQLAQDSVLVVTGGARGVTYAIVKALAERLRLKIIVLARTDAASPAQSPLNGKTEEQQKELAKVALHGKVERLTPMMVQRWITHERNRLEVGANLETLRQLGSQVELKICDVADTQALSRVCATIRAEYGTIDVVLHGAGVEESKPLVDKDPQAFDRVFTPKAQAALTLQKALAPQLLVTMGSVSGRFGNAGQTDYSAANEMLSAMSRAPQSQMLNLAWTAWGDVGMATRGSIQQVLESVGVKLMPVQIGSQIGADLIAGLVTGDFVVAGALGEFDISERQIPYAPFVASLPWIFDRLEEGTVYIRRLDPTIEKGLDHHRIEGTAVLPGVLGVEMMVRAAEHALQTQVGKLVDVRFASPLKIFKDQPVEARVEVKRNGEVTLSSYFTAPNGKQMKREHFTARVQVASEQAQAISAPRVVEMARDPGISKAELYRRYFHGPSFQVLDRIVTLGEDGADAMPAEQQVPWIKTDEVFVSAPYYREAGFQTAGLWEMAELGRMALPSGIDEVTFGSAPPADKRLVIQARKRDSDADGAVFDIWVRDEDGVIYDVMRGYRTAKLRDLLPEERFEPTQAKHPAPIWQEVDIKEITAACDADLQGTLDRYLSVSEQALFKNLKSQKRKREWLAGRVAAKSLIREAKFYHEGAIVPYQAIEIVANDLGAPEIRIVGDLGPQLQVSISHSAGVAAAMLSSSAKLIPGIDVEQIETRDASFAQTYFVESEQTLAKADPDKVLTLLWAIKEAVLKALGIGARVDLRDIVVSQHKDSWQVELHNEAQARAQKIGAGVFEVHVDVIGKRVVARVLLPVLATSVGHSSMEASA
jgi:malonyl CoA-acyl carrier protein transacylase